MKCEERNELNIENISEKIAKKYNVSMNEIKSSARSANISKPRKIIAYISREYLKLKLEDIAKYLVKKHQTIMYGSDQIKEKIKKDFNLKKEINEILNELGL